MTKLKYKLLPEGAADGLLKLILIFVDKKDVSAAGLSFLEACEAVARDFPGAAAVDIVDLDAVTVTSDGIMADGAVVAFASIDHGKINPEFGFIAVSERPYSCQLLAEEPHMKQWDVNYPGRRLYRGPSPEDKGIRDSHNENMTITGRIANNNTGSEMFNLVDMTEVLTPFYGILQIMRDKEVLMGICGPEISVGIGMVVRERGGRIFGWAYGAGQTAHRSGVYAKTVKGNIPVIVGPKPMVAEYTLRAFDAGMVPGRHISCSPVNLSLARAVGHPMDLDNISKDAWAELESIGITRAWLEEPVAPLTREEALRRADEILPGVIDGKIYKVSEISEIHYAECD